jgi:hypothetical protein
VVLTLGKPNRRPTRLCFNNFNNKIPMSFISFTKLAKFRAAQDFARFREMGGPFWAVANRTTTFECSK